MVTVLIGIVAWVSVALGNPEAAVLAGGDDALTGGVELELTTTVAAAILGVVQGLTEFLPISSSGHLVLFQHFLPVSGDPLLFDLVVHLGTLLPIIVVYRSDLAGIYTDVVHGQLSFWQRPGVRLLMLILIGTVPTGIIGLSFSDFFEGLLSSPIPVGVAFFFTGCLLWSTRWAKQGDEDETRAPLWKGACMGVAQGIAITPGVSRSGSTIAAGLFLGLDREAAARISFLLSIPAIVGACIMEFGHLSNPTPSSLIPLAVGFTTAALSGYLALTLLLLLVKRGDFSGFAWYLWPLAIVAVFSGLYA